MKKWPFARENHNLRDLRSPLVAANYLRNRQGMISSKQIRSIFPPVKLKALDSRLVDVEPNGHGRSARGFFFLRNFGGLKGEKVPSGCWGGLCKEYLLLGVFSFFF